MKLDPTVLEEARNNSGFTNDEQLGAAIGLTSATVRSYRAGQTVPSIRALAALRKLTGRTFDSMIVP